MLLYAFFEDRTNIQGEEGSGLPFVLIYDL